MKKILCAGILVLLFFGATSVHAMSALKQKQQLFDAVMVGDIETVKVLIDAGALLNVKDGVGNTPLMYAAMYGYTGIVEVLIENGADINYRARNGYTALMWAEEMQNYPIADILRGVETE